jgi:hypothetical protein
MAAVDFESEAPRQRGGALDLVGFGRAGGRRIGVAAGVNLDSVRAGLAARLDLPLVGGDEEIDLDPARL